MNQDADAPNPELYRALTTNQLRELRAAFTADRADAVRRPLAAKHTVEFCNARLALIARVLGERGVTD